MLQDPAVEERENVFLHVYLKHLQTDILMDRHYSRSDPLGVVKEAPLGEPAVKVSHVEEEALHTAHIGRDIL